MFGFETDPSRRRITVWREDGSGEVPPGRITLAVSSLQKVLRESGMVDDGTIRWIAEEIPLTGAIRVRDADGLFSLLQPFEVEPH